MRNQNGRVRRNSSASWVCVLIFLFLEIVYIVYRLLDTRIKVLAPIIDLIGNISTIITIICACLGSISLIRKPRNPGLSVACLVDIVLANGLYRNERLKQIKDWFVSLDKTPLIFGAAILGAIILIMYLIIKRKDNVFDEPTPPAEESVAPTPQPVTSEKAEHLQYHPQAKNPSYFGAYLVTLGTLIAFFLWALIDCLIFNILPLDLDRPATSVATSGILYFALTFCPALIISFIIIVNVRKKYIERKTGTKEGNSDKTRPNWASKIISLSSVALAFYFEWFLLANKDLIPHLEKVSLELFQNNALTFICVLLVIFLALRLLIHTVLNHLLEVFGWKKPDTEHTKKWNTQMQKVQDRLTNVSFKLINDGIKVMEILPDFIESITTVLWDSEEDEQTHDTQKEVPANEQE